MLMPFPGETGHCAVPTSRVKASIKTEHAVVGDAVGDWVGDSDMNGEAVGEVVVGEDVGEVVVGEDVGEHVEQSHIDPPAM